jgi:hypothetical protein
MLRCVEEKHPEAEDTGELAKFFLFLVRKLIKQSSSTLGGESRVPKIRRAICMLENGPNSSMKSEELKASPIKVTTVDRIWVSQEFRREEFLCGERWRNVRHFF